MESTCIPWVERNCIIRENGSLFPIGNKRPMGYIAHLRKQFKSINTYDFQNVDEEKKKPIIYFMRIECFFVWTNLNPLHSRMFCAKFGWNWLSGSGEHFKISSMYFRYFFNISPWKGFGPSFVQTSILITKGRIVFSLVEIGPVVLEKKILNFVNVFSLFRKYLPLKKSGPFIWTNFHMSLGYTHVSCRGRHKYLISLEKK